MSGTNTKKVGTSAAARNKKGAKIMRTEFCSFFLGQRRILLGKIIMKNESKKNYYNVLIKEELI
jgi:hypothetical protein